MQKICCIQVPVQKMGIPVFCSRQGRSGETTATFSVLTETARAQFDASAANVELQMTPATREEPIRIDPTRHRHFGLIIAPFPLDYSPPVGLNRPVGAGWVARMALVVCIGYD